MKLRHRGLTNLLRHVSKLLETNNQKIGAWFSECLYFLGYKLKMGHDFKTVHVHRSLIFRSMVTVLFTANQWEEA